MAYNTAILQGRFTSDGAERIISLRSDLDYMEVLNLTQMAATNNVGVKYEWYRGFAAGTGIRYFKSGGGNALNATDLASPNGFTLVNTSADPTGNRVAVTSTTNATQPVVATGDTTGLATGTIVRLDSIATADSLNGFDFEIDNVVGSTSFRMRYAMANAPGTAGGAGFYRVIDFDPIYYPRRRFIVNITQAASAVVTTSVQHGYTVGQKVRFTIPAAFDMVELDGLEGTITAVTTSTFTVNIDTSAFTAFSFALPADLPFNFAQVVPFGEDTAQALSSGVDILGGATENQAVLGMKLAGGADTPGGATSDVMYWRAVKSFSVDNQ